MSIKEIGFVIFVGSALACCATQQHGDLNESAAFNVSPPSPSIGVSSPTQIQPERYQDLTALHIRGDSMAVVGKYVFRGTTAGLMCGEYDGSAGHYEETATAYLPDAVLDVAVAGSVVYAAGGARGVHIIDVSNPTDPNVLGTVTFSGAALGLDVYQNQLLVSGGSGGVLLLDISNPLDPVVMASWKNGGYVRDGRLVGGNTIFIAEDTQGVSKLLFDSGRLRREWSVSTHGQARALELIDGDIYVANGAGGLAVLSANQEKETNPPVIFQMDGETRDLAFDESQKRLYIALGSGGLAGVDLPLNMEKVSFHSLRTEKPVNRIVLFGSRLFVGNDVNGLMVLRVDNHWNWIREYPAKI